MRDRVWDIIELLDRFDAGATLTTQQIARRYEVSQRTAQRWIAAISEHRRIERVWGEYGLSRCVAYRRAG